MGFSSFVKHYYDSSSAANVCTQFMDDFAAGVNNSDETIPALRKIPDCLRESGRELSAKKLNLERQKLTT